MSKEMDEREEFTRYSRRGCMQFIGVWGPGGHHIIALATGAETTSCHIGRKSYA